METFKLISMTYFVLECDTLEKAQNYAKFLKQPLTLGMFVPCSEDGDVLIESFSEKYKEAKERVLFKDCFYDEASETVFYKYYESPVFYLFMSDPLTIESLVDLELTETARKQLGIKTFLEVAQEFVKERLGEK